MHVSLCPTTAAFLSNLRSCKIGHRTTTVRLFIAVYPFTGYHYIPTPHQTHLFPWRFIYWTWIVKLKGKNAINFINDKLILWQNHHNVEVLTLQKAELCNITVIYGCIMWFFFWCLVILLATVFVSWENKLWNCFAVANDFDCSNKRPLGFSPPDGAKWPATRKNK